MDLGRHPRIGVWAAAAVLAAVPVLAGCSSEPGGAAAGSAAFSGVSVARTAAGPADPGAAKAQIEKNWAAVFDPKVTAEDKAALLQNGELLEPLLAGIASVPYAAEASAEVTEVVFTSPTEARVTYDVFVAGIPVLDAREGTAVFEDGVWKVSAKTLCGLVERSGREAPGC
ncbi:hypothetical protein ACFWBN_36365 [Streptomyces sp. NPDC059989]|uniref:hypothetical protein n=1 Tax=Streptomyces sp. NPDC059989 TaxID=3347026 RepID=UPI0036769580